VFHDDCSEPRQGLDARTALRYKRTMLDARRVASHLGFDVVLPFGLSAILFFSFDAGRRSAIVDSVEAFEERFAHGIQAYRVVGRELLLALHHASASLHNTNLRQTFAVFTGLFFAATMLIVSLRAQAAGRDRFEQTAVRAVALLTIAASLYKVTPNDLPSYALICAAAWAYLHARTGSRSALASCCALLITATLVRESSALVLAFAATLEHLDKRSGVRVRLGAIIGAFVLSYVSLRLALGRFDVVQGWALADLARPAPWISLAVGTSLLALATQIRIPPGFVPRFLLFSTPYLFIIMLAADPAELRLLVPLVLLVLCAPAGPNRATALGPE